ncbi:uncharacterized protein LOC128726758 [Anopheles nili]|uniref:uncharacterized protein LOC128726758 n=1 Tax=Anopheles nili TaxID=185578 RepID=UPI00237A41CC|nr:uncharacterized protein LOC128726758 [Anopheles nili]
MRTMQLVTLLSAVLVVLMMFIELASPSPALSNPQEMTSFESDETYGPVGVQFRVGMVQTLTCANPTCSAQCRGRGYRRGSCNIGRCFCSYV